MDLEDVIPERYAWRIERFRNKPYFPFIVIAVLLVLGTALISLKSAYYLLLFFVFILGLFWVWRRRFVKGIPTIMIVIVGLTLVKPFYGFLLLWSLSTFLVMYWLRGREYKKGVPTALGLIIFTAAVSPEICAFSIFTIAWVVMWLIIGLILRRRPGVHEMLMRHKFGKK